METPQQATFNEWAIVEVMGHQTYAGYVTTQAFGAAVLFRARAARTGRDIAARRLYRRRVHAARIESAA